MAAASWVGSRKFTGVLLASALLSACGGGDLHSSNLLSGTAATGVPLVGATVRLRCADGSALQTSTNASGLWQITVTGQPLPCIVQASGGSVNDLQNATAYHTVALSFGVANITPLTNLVTARMLSTAPQAWFEHPDFASANAANLQTALTSVLNGLGLSGTMGSSDPFTEPFAGDSYFYLLDRVLVAMASALSDPLVNQDYAQLLDAAVAGDFQTHFAAYGTAFAKAYAKLPAN